MAKTKTRDRGSQQSRILAPDIARGVALLGIALANVGTAWVPAPSTQQAENLGGIVHGSIVEQIAVVLSAMFIHVRGLPMFSALLGYGVGMIMLSLWRRKYPVAKARMVLVKRYGFLALFGVIHMIFLFWGDIMFFYGVAGILLALMITLKDKVCLWVAGVMIGVYIIGTIAFTVILPLVGGFDSNTAFTTADLQSATYGEHVMLGLLLLVSQIAALPIEIIMLMPVMLIGFVAARHRVLSRIDEFRKQLWIAIWVALAVIVLVGLPWGLSEIGVLPSTWVNTLYALNQAFGPLTGPGIVAAIALSVQPIQRKASEAAVKGQPVRLSIVIRMVAALGARSMSGYVAQSILFLILTQQFSLGWGIGGGILSISGIAILVWFITLIAAFGLELAAKPGPFEAMHRRLAYGRNGLQQTFRPNELTQPGYAPIPGAQPISPYETEK